MGTNSRLDSLQAASSHPIACYVLANACTDRTEALVRDYAASHANVHLVSIEVGDKANAWNVFVHEVAPSGAAHYFFIDGDVRATVGALDAMAQALENVTVKPPRARSPFTLPSDHALGNAGSRWIRPVWLCTSISQ